MTTPLSVTPARLEPEYASFQDAIAASRKGSRAAEALESTKLLSGAQIESVWFTDTTFDIMLDKKVDVSLFLKNSIVCWSLKPANMADRDATSSFRQPSTLSLLFSNSIKAYSWNRLEIATALVGHQLARICTGETWLSIDVRGQHSLMFMCLAIADGGQLLYFDPE